MKKVSSKDVRRVLGMVSTATLGGVTGALEGGGFRDKPLAFN